MFVISKEEIILELKDIRKWKVANRSAPKNRLSLLPYFSISASTRHFTFLTSQCNIHACNLAKGIFNNLIPARSRMSFKHRNRHVLYLEQYQSKMSFPKYFQRKSIPSKIQALRMGLNYFELGIESKATSKIETVSPTKQRLCVTMPQSRQFLIM